MSPQSVAPDMKPLLLKQDSLFKRRKRKWTHRWSGFNGGNVLIVTAYSFCLLALIKPLFPCDMSRPFVLSALGHQEDDSIAAAAAAAATSAHLQLTTVNNNNNNRQRLLEEPKDTVAVFGQPARLTCLVENKQGEHYWVRNGAIFKHELGNATSTLPESSSAGQQVQVQNGAQVTDASLLINRVALTDEGRYECVVHPTSDQPELISRVAKLTVLKPPTQLSISTQTLADGADQPEAHNEPAQPSSELIIAADGSVPEQQPTLMQQQQQQTNSETIERIIVKQNVRLRLECRTDKAKPHAELVWLDHQQRQVSKTANLDDNYFNETGSGDSASSSNHHHQLGDLIRAGQEADGEWVKLAWTFRVQRHHHDQVLTCQAQHPAFENRRLSEQLYARELRRQVRLEVQYEPEIELTKDQLHLNESNPVTFQCLASGRPNQLTYRWFIDEELVANASEPELRIERITRQLHLRELKCEVSNAVGTSQATLRLAVRYAAHYVTHLLPPSLQPAIPEPEGLGEQLRQAAAARQVQRRGQSQWPKAGQVALARQLALGFDPGQDVQLRCDFDANPRPQQVLWYKVNFNWTIMQDVTPERADEYIAGGAANAIFRRPTGRQVASGKHAKRHIAQPANENHQHSSNQHLRNLWTEELDSQDNRQLDYERMSAELLAELADFEAQNHLSNQQPADLSITSASSDDEQHVKPMATQTPTPTTVAILEPLGWRLLNPRRDHLHLAAQDTPRLSLVPDSGIGAPTVSPISIQLLAPNSSSDAQVRLVARETQVSSSYVLLRNVNDKSIGRYLCAAKNNDGYPMVARAVHLVQRSPPRLISVQDQFAPLGSHELQVECLVQINTVADNRTAISWFKDGKLIENVENRYKLQVEHSPDLLFMRSTLLIMNADFYDFGLYNCTVNSAFPDPQDYLPITLRPSTPTGLVFAVMAFLAIGSVLVLVCVVGLLLICGPIRNLSNVAAGRKPTTKLKSSAADVSLKVNYSQTDIASQSSDRKSPRSLGSGQDNEDEGIVVSQQSNELLAAANQQRHMMDLQSQQNQLTVTYDDSQLMAHHRQQLQSSLRRDLRHSLGARAKSGNFAAIHESLEHKLQLGQPPPFPRAPSAGDQLNHYQQPQQAPVPALTGGGGSAVANTVVKGQAISELERSSLFNRLWARLLMKPADQCSGTGSRRVKSRPVISMPVQVSAAGNGGQSKRRRSSLSTSLSLLSSVATPDHLSLTGANQAAHNHLKSNSMNLAHTKHAASGQLVSSSANLIQDSTTASDNTASSGRSSSSSNSAGHHVQNHQLAAQNTMVSALPSAHLDPYATTPYLWQQQQPHLNHPTGAIDCSLYANQDAGTGYLPADLHQVSPGFPTGVVEHHHHLNGYPSNQPLGWPDPNRSMQVNHYQLPMMTNGDAYHHQQQPPVRPCYATICTDPNQFNTTVTTSATGASNYGTLPVRCHQVMIPTSNAGEDYFESHYDALISGSSAYKTLYAQHNKPSPLPLKMNGCLSNSNSPNGSSTCNGTNTTTTNGSSSDNNNRNNQGVLHVELKLNDSQQVDCVPSSTNGSSEKQHPAAQLVANKPSDNGQATHV